MTELACYSVCDGKLPTVRAAPKARQWMEETRDRFAYRCLPMTIANQHGWQILNMAPFAARWDGGDGKEAVTITPLENDYRIMPSPQLGHGLLTFTIACFFRTEPGLNLWATGPINHVKDGVQPLTGIIETDWWEGPFLMNWKMTRPNVHVVFKKDEPICQVFPVPRDLVESVEPVFRDIRDEPELCRRYAETVESRRKFSADLKIEGSAARAEGWQKNYMRGRTLQGEKGPPAHRTSLKLKEFRWEGDGRHGLDVMRRVDAALAGR
jgi:hypothetical protein